jgi:DnaJ-class molecular chaperone
VITMDLTLSESLCGFTRTIPHMDGRIIRIDSKPGNVVKPDAVKMIQGEGMPHHGNPFTKGRLFVHFRVAFPATLSAEIVQQLVATLPKPALVTLNGEEEECCMSDVDLSQFGQDTGGGRHMTANDDDDEEDGGRGQQKVQCQNM